jgi:hypothetical protein
MVYESFDVEKGQVRWMATFETEGERVDMEALMVSTMQSNLATIMQSI